MKPKKLYKHVSQKIIPIYDHAFEVIITEDMDGVARKINPDDPLIGCAAMTRRVGKCVSIVFSDNCKVDRGKIGVTHNTIAHEVYHAISEITSCAGLKYDSRWHEEFAYLTGYVTGLVYKDLERWGIKIS